MRGLTEALDLEWQHFGIRVMSVWPLFVQTAMVSDMDAKSIKALGVQLTPQHVAAVILQVALYQGRPKVHWPVGLQGSALIWATWTRVNSGGRPDRGRSFNPARPCSA